MRTRTDVAAPVLAQKGTVIQMPTLSSKDAARVKQLMARREPCILCGSRKVTVRGLFAPYKPALWGDVAEKTRLIGYCLCKKCFRFPDDERSTKIEARLAAGVVGNRN